MKQMMELTSKWLIVCEVCVMILLASCTAVSQPEITPTNLASIPMPTATTVLTASPSETSIPAATKPGPTETNNDVLYVWQPLYWYLTTNNVIDPMRNMHKVHPAINQAEPFRPLDMFFSPYFGDVAYVMQGEHQELEVWVSSLDLSDTRLVWADTNNILGFSSPTDQVIDIQWGPNARFILVSLNSPDQLSKSSISIVVDVQTQAYWQVADKCSHYSRSGEKPDVLLLYCRLASDEYLALDSDGSHQIVPSIASTLPQINAWRMSPNGSSILYRAGQNDIFVDVQGSSLDLQTKLGAFLFVDDIEPLQWSRDGKRLLVWGDGANCAYGQVSPCWQVFDAYSGNLLWTEDTVTHGMVAALSPDGEELVRFVAGGPMDRMGVITQLATNSSETFMDTTFAKVIWVTK